MALQLLLATVVLVDVEVEPEDNDEVVARATPDDCEWSELQSELPLLLRPTEAGLCSFLANELLVESI